MTQATQPLTSRREYETPSFFSNRTVDGTTLLVSRAVLGVFGLAATALTIEGAVSAQDIGGIIVRTFPSPVYTTGYVILGISVVGGVLSLLFSPSQKALPPAPLVSMHQVNAFIHHLCEIDTAGNPQECSLDQMKNIMRILKEQNVLPTLNTIPEYILNSSYQTSVYSVPQPLYTPLQYWAAKGDLQAVKILLENGAADRCLPGDGISGKITSALYAAAVHGNDEVVLYLLSKGAQADIAFNENIFFSFIPNFVFDVCQKQLINNEDYLCLVLILFNLKEHNPKNLEQQLQIPIDKGRNCMAYLTYKKPANYQVVHNLLSSFGGDQRQVYSFDTLKAAGYEMGTGYTLEELTTLKRAG